MKKERKTIADYVYHTGTAKNASDYPVITAYLVNFIKKNYVNGEDIGTALEMQEQYSFENIKPKMNRIISEELKGEEIEAQKEENKILYEAEVASYVKRRDLYNSNLGKAYAFIWGQCSKTMQNKIQSRKDYDNIKGDPIALLKSIKEHSLSYHENKYAMCTVLDAYKNFINLKQKDDESLIDYTRRFKAARDVLQTQIGDTMVFPGYSDTLKQAKFKLPEPASDPSKMKSKTTIVGERINKEDKEAYQHFQAYLLLVNSDQLKYGSLVINLASQYSLGHDQYPKDVTSAVNVLSNHKFDQTHWDNKKKKRQALKDNHKERQQNKQQDDDDGETIQLSFAQLEGKCYCCGKAGHKSPQCRNKNKPKSEWAINRTSAAQHMQNAQRQQPPTQVQQVPTQSSASLVAESRQDINEEGEQHLQFDFMAVQIPQMVNRRGIVMSQLHQDNMKEWILLDSESSVDLFCNSRYVKNIRKAHTVLHLNTNAGSMAVNQMATLDGYGDVWFHPRAITNVLSLANVRRKHTVTYNSNQELAFIVHTPTKTVKFQECENNLHIYKPSQAESIHGTILVETIKDNATKYTQRQLTQAKAARKLLHALGYPSINDLKSMIKMNAIKDCPITIEDIQVAQDVYGPAIPSLKGKTTRTTPSRVVRDVVEVPPELLNKHRAIELYFDVFKINNMPYFATISNIYFQTSEYAKSSKVVTYRNLFIRVCQIYDRAGFVVVRCACDREFLPLTKYFPKLHFNIATAKEHVPQAERNNRVIQERVRAIVHASPFDCFPRIFIHCMASEAANMLNYFPNKHGISAYYSPRDILQLPKLDFKKHCQIPMFTYVQAHDEPTFTNTPMARTLDCIYLRPTSSHQGGHQLYHLPTRKIITRHKVTPIPMPQAIVASVNQIGNQEGMTGFKITTRRHGTYTDTAWTAGVGDQEHENENENENETESDESTNDSDNGTESNASDASEQEEESSVHTVSEDEDDKEEEVDEYLDAEITGVRQSQRTKRTINRLEPTMQGQSYLQEQSENEENNSDAIKLEYKEKEASVVAFLLTQVIERVTTPTMHHGEQHVLSYSVQKGIKKFGQQ